MASSSTTGPVAAYNFDAGAGTTLADLSGNGSNGTISGAAWTKFGHSGGALSFDGSGDWVTVPDASNLDLSSAMTLEAWVYPSQLGSLWRTIVTKEQSGSLVYGLFANSDSTTPAALTALPAQDVVRGSSRLPKSTWTYVAATYDGAALRLYVNGAQAASTPGSGAMPASTQPLRIGGNGVASQWFRGRIDDVRVYNRALSASEIQNDMSTAVASDTQAPSAPTGLTASSPTMSSVSLAWTASSDNVGVLGYTLYRDGTAVGSSTATSYQVTGLACGATYSFSVDAFDAAGNRSAKATVSAATSACPPPPDSTPPTTPSGLATSGATQTSVTLSWSASTDDVGVSGYGLYRNGTSVGSTSTRSYSFSGLVCGTSYTLAVDAYDAMGNRSPRASISAATAACADTAAPTAPTGLAASGQTQSSITLSWTASTDNVGVAGYGRYLDGSLVTSGTGTSYTFSGLLCGTSYALAVDAYDAAGNRSSKPSLTATTSACVTDTQAPSVPPNERYTGFTPTTITLAWDASTDNVGVAGYSMFLNDVKVATTTQLSYTFSGLACGTTYTISLQAFDAAGNGSDRTFSTGTASTTACATADTQAPSVPPNERYTGVTKTSITLAWDASTDNVGVAGYSMFLNDVKIATTTQLSYTFSGLSCGTTYTISVQAFDAAGNGSDRALSTGTSATAACSTGSDTQAPTIPSALAATGATASSISIAWGASLDNVGVAGYGEYRNGTSVGSATGTAYTFSGLSCGTSYNLAVDAYDAAGNRSAKATISAATSACADTSAPTTPTNVVATGATQTSISLSWTASLDNVAVVGYTVYNGANSAGATASTAYTVSGLTCGTSYSLAVDAYDSVGNRSAKATLSATTSACSPPPPPPGGGTSLANLWIDPSGGSCTRAGSPATYSDGAACSWQQANSACQGGDNVFVKSGSYGNLVIRGSNGRSSACTIKVEPGQTVTVGSLELGIWQSCSPGANSTSTTNWLTIVGPLKSREFHADCSNQITVDNLDMDAGGQQITQPFQVQADANNFTLRNSKVHNALNPNAMMVLQGNYFTLDNNDIYDDINNTNGAIHDECLRTQPVQHMRLTRNHFWSCNVMDVFLTGDSGGNLATDWLIENNIFEAPTGSAGNAANAVYVRDGSDAYVVPDGFIVRYNTFGSTGMYVAPGNSTPTGNGMQIYGNYFATNSPCGMPNTSYSYNVTPTGIDNCGGTGAKSFAASSLNAGFVNYHPYDGNGGASAEPAGDYTLVSTSPLKNVGSMSSYPALDRLANARYAGAGPDVGAYEYQGA